MTTRGKCALCEYKEELMQSHIIPKFIFSHQKNTSATGFLRSNEYVNRRSQDGFKLYMLCRNCEGLMNKWETLFANEIFYPQCNCCSSKLEYGPWMLKFATSVSWRALTWHKKKAAENNVSGRGTASQIDQALLAWKCFMLNETPNPGKYEQHMLPMDRLDAATNCSELPTNINRFLTRGAYINLVTDEKSRPLFIFSKMARFFLLGFIGIERPRQWRGTKLHVKNGHIGGEMFVPASFFDYLVESARRTQELHCSISEKQKSIIDETLKKDEKRTIESETIQMMAADIEMFGLDNVVSE